MTTFDNISGARNSGSEAKPTLTFLNIFDARGVPFERRFKRNGVKEYRERMEEEPAIAAWCADGILLANGGDRPELLVHSL